MVDVLTPRLQALLGPPRPIDRMPAGATLKLNSEYPLKDLNIEVRNLANVFAATQTESKSPAESRRTWHHLLMAVANMRSRAGNLHLGGSYSYLDESPDVAFSSFRIPKRAPHPDGSDADTDEIVVTVDDPDSWRALMDSVPGLTVPTTSTLLAALWPASHVVFDNIVIGALIGLQAMDEQGRPHVGVTGAALNSIWRDVVTGTKSWTDYEWYVATLQATVNKPELASKGVSLVALERTLSLVGGKAAGYSASQWPEWAMRLNDVVALADVAWAEVQAGGAPKADD